MICFVNTDQSKELGRTNDTSNVVGSGTKNAVTQPNKHGIVLPVEATVISPK